MYLVLQHVGGSATIMVRQGQKVTVGRTAWSDYAFPHDEGLREVHFSLECAASGAIVIPIDGAELLLENVPTRGTALRHGQLLQAGRTQFKVFLEGIPDGTTMVDSPAQESSGEPAVLVAESNRKWLSAPATLEALSLSPLPEDIEPSPSSPVELAQLLVATGCHGDALQVIAWCADRVDAVGWTADCVENYLAQSMTESERTALAAARAWCAEPTQENCQAAGLAAEEAGLGTPPGWVAQTVFWSGENLSSPDLPAVAPPPVLPSAGIKGALVSLAFAVAPNNPVAIMNECLALGYQLPFE